MSSAQTPAPTPTPSRPRPTPTPPTPTPCAFLAATPHPTHNPPQLLTAPPSAREADDDGVPAPLTMVDVHPAFEAMGNPDSFYADDELHLSSEGYTYWEEWAGLALATPECPMWEGGTCSCEDDESWHFAGKPGKTCEYVRAAAARRDEPTSTISPTTQTTLTPTANHQRSRPNLFPFPFFPTLPLAASPSLIHYQPLP